MSRPSPYVITLSDTDRAMLEARSRAYTAPHHQVLRARIVSLAADGMANVAIADRLDVSVATVSLWRQRFFAEGLTGLAERKRSGRPRTSSPSGAGGGDGAGLRTAVERPASGRSAAGWWGGRGPARGKGKEMQDRLTKLVTIFNDLDFRRSRAEGDDLPGDAYEYLMRHFATKSGKSKGQF